MFEHNDDKNIDWDKLAARLDGDPSATDFTEEELRVLAAEREMRIRMAPPAFSERDGWQQFDAIRSKRRIVHILRLTVAAILILAIERASGCLSRTNKVQQNLPNWLM